MTELIGVAFHQIHQYEQCYSRGSIDHPHPNPAALMCYELFLLG